MGAVMVKRELPEADYSKIGKCIVVMTRFGIKPRNMLAVFPPPAEMGFRRYGLLFKS